MSEEIIDIVNLTDDVVGQESLQRAHEMGQLHRLAMAWFYNSKGEVLLQQRHKLRPDAPSLLDFTVGGHVKAGQSYEEALLQETQEETGVIASLKDFAFLAAYIPKTEGRDDLVIHTRYIWAYHFEKDISSLVFDPEELLGFEWRSVDKLFEDMKLHPELFVPFLPQQVSVEILRKILELSK